MATVSLKNNRDPELIFGVLKLVNKHGIKTGIFFGAS